MDKLILETKKLVFDKCNFKFSNFETEKESSDYCACKFEINSLKIVFRQAKITPTKVGQFVTLWKRETEKSPIAPFEIADSADLFVINVRKGTNFGQFVFPKSVLVERGIISYKKEGKRGFRVYPIWDLTESKQANTTQKWQLDYFLRIPIDETLDVNRAQLLYRENSI
jgi:hypothetical protein